MKTKILLLSLLSFSFFSTKAADVIVNDFESGSPAVSVHTWGGSYLNTANPVVAGINTTANCGKVGRTGTNFYEAIKFDFAAGYAVPANQKRYIHIMVNSTQATVTKIQVNKTTPYITANNSLVGNGTWQDIVFEVTGAAAGTTISSLYIFCDIGTGINGSGKLDNVSKFSYIDEIMINDSPIPRGGTALTGNNLYDFEPATTANATGISTFANETNPVVYPFENPYKTGMNTTDNVGKRTSDGTLGLWYAGFTFTFSNIVLIDDTHKYLHVMMMAPVDNQVVRFDVKQGNTKVVADGEKTITTANTWQDVVFDVSAMNYISGMSIKCGTPTATAVGDYYFDEIRIDNDPTPRSNTSTALSGPTEKLNIYSSNGTIVIDNIGNHNVSVFNNLGQQIINTNATKSVNVPVNSKGLYFVRIGSKTTKILVD